MDSPIVFGQIPENTIQCNLLSFIDFLGNLVGQYTGEGCGNKWDPAA